MTIEMPERLVKSRREELGVETEDFLNMIRFLTFVDVDVHGIAFPPSQQLDVVLGDAVAVGCDCRSFPQ